MGKEKATNMSQWNVRLVLRQHEGPRLVDRLARRLAVSGLRRLLRRKAKGTRARVCSQQSSPDEPCPFPAGVPGDTALPLHASEAVVPEAAALRLAAWCQERRRSSPASNLYWTRGRHASIEVQAFAAMYADGSGVRSFPGYLGEPKVAVPQQPKTLTFYGTCFLPPLVARQ